MIYSLLRPNIQLQKQPQWIFPPWLFLFHSISRKIKEALRQNFSMGLPNWHRKCYGCERTANGSPVINHGEAKIVQWMFESYCNGNNL